MSSSQSIDDLFQAAKRGDIDAVNRLISEGADVNAVGAHNNTPLHWATEEGHKGVVEVLLNNGANVNAQNDKEETPLDLATDEGIQTLLQNTTKLLEAAKNSDSDSDEVRRLISEGASVNATDEDRRTPLHWAAEKGYKQVVQALLDNGANVNAGAFGLNITPLHLAVASRHEKIVEILLNKGANVNLVESSRGMTSLWLAAEKGYGNVATVLLTAKEIDVNTYPRALRFAAVNGREGVVKVLLTAEKIDVAAKGIHEKTLLHLAAEKGYTDIVNTLLRKGADVNAKDYFGNTPLHCAAANGHTEIVSALIRSEGINVYAKDNKNNAPLDLAKKNNHNEVVEVLKQAQENIEALCSAVKNGNAQEVDTLVEALLQGRFGDNLSIGTNIDNIVDEDGNTPLHLAVLLNKIEMVKILIGYSKNVNIVDEDGNTPLDLAKTEEIRTLLLKAAENPVDGSVDESSTDSEEVLTTGSAQPIAPTEPAQTEEQPSSFLVVCLVYL